MPPSCSQFCSICCSPSWEEQDEEETTTFLDVWTVSTLATGTRIIDKIKQVLKEDQQQQPDQPEELSLICSGCHDLIEQIDFLEKSAADAKRRLNNKFKERSKKKKKKKRKKLRKEEQSGRRKRGGKKPKVSLENKQQDEEEDDSDLVTNLVQVKLEEVDRVEKKTCLGKPYTRCTPTRKSRRLLREHEAIFA